MKSRAKLFKLVNGIILIQGKIEDISGYFALDTGATQTVLNKTYCSVANAAVDKAITFDSGTQSSEIASLDTVRLVLGDEKIEKKNSLIMDMTYVETPLRKDEPGLIFLGSIGADMIGRGRLIIDYIDKQTIFCADETPVNAKEIRFSVEKKLPIVAPEICGKAYRFVLDTGANHFVMNQSTAPMEAICDSADADAPHCIRSLFFADREYRNLTGMITDLSALNMNIDGIIGYQLLKDYICCFDYDKKRLYLKQK